MATIMLKRLSVQLICLLLTAFAGSAQAIQVEQLNTMLKAGEHVTIIDIRVNSSYQKGHILNAMNIPASIIDRKKLPPLGDVYVYGDGIDDELVDNAVISLNQKPGIRAEAVDGGYTAWISQYSTVTRKHEMTVSQVRNLTYQKLKRMTSRSKKPVLVDLRVGDDLERLDEHFPDTTVIDVITGARAAKPSPAKSSAKSKRVVDQSMLSLIPKNNRQALILIDNGDGFSEQFSDKLHAAGVRRVAILAGGERTLETRGVSQDKLLSTGAQ
jgi:rhodanese-related sulfurtransferase